MKFLRLRLLLSISVVLLCFVGCYYGKGRFAYHAPGVNMGVDKKLKGKVILYAVFVDAKAPKPWTSYDIASTLDSINLATQWIEGQAQLNGIPLNIETICHSNKKTVPIYEDFPRKSLSGALVSKTPGSGVKRIRKWADRVSKQAGMALPKDTSSIILTPNKMEDRERLIARIRDIHKTDNVVLMFFINNYYTEEISIAVDSRTNGMPEFSIVSFKNPAVIAHEFLHLFGAIDLYTNPLYRNKIVMKNKYEILKDFPNEIMAFSHNRIETLEIGAITQYHIGWKKELDEKYKNLLFGKRRKIIKYN